VEPPVKQVPLAALQEERTRRQELQRRIDALEAKIAAPERKDPVALMNEDPERAMAAMMEEVENLRTEIARVNMERDIRTEVPDFFEKAAEMEELLLGEGFDEEGIKNLIGSSGKNAPKLFKILARSVSAVDEKAVREKITSELTPQITASVTAQVTKDLLAKFQIPESPTNLTKVPGSGPAGALKIETEADFARLTPEQQEKWLSGDL
jgi:hypothetical protein